MPFLDELAIPWAIIVFSIFPEISIISLTRSQSVTCHCSIRLQTDWGTGTGFEGEFQQAG